MRHWSAAIDCGIAIVGLAGAAVAQGGRTGSILAATSDMYSPGVAVLSAAPPGTTRTGAGFFIGPGRFVTLRSALAGAESATVTMDSGRVLPVTKIVAEDVDADLAVVFVEVPAALRRGLGVNPLPAVPGEDAIVIGPPTKPGEDLPKHAVAPVVVGGKAAVGSLDGFEIKGEVAAGLAGSPVLNASGQVIGVVSAAPPIGDSTVVIPSMRLADLTDAPGLTLAEWAAGKTVDSTRPPPGEAAAAAATAKVVKRDDGSVLIDDRFVVNGDGTKEKPYVVPWDLLISAQETYAPRNGKNTIPERVSMLEGKWVSLTGFVAFPLMVEEPTDLLSMMNQWDGCCIGVPPTPYDAVEVRLTGPVKGDDALLVHGTVTGRLSIDPQLVGNWLVGLYLMEESSFKGSGR